MITCHWCGAEYDGTPLYHVCDDGSTFDIRSIKDPQDFEVERKRRARLKESQAIERRRRFDDVSTGCFTGLEGWEKPMETLTPYDMNLLRGIRIKWEGDKR